jgi:3-hydroxymyristoyl/3-hydroxydecanoyl-(acyl carrier protein) dehydratase
MEVSSPSGTCDSYPGSPAWMAPTLRQSWSSAGIGCFPGDPIFPGSLMIEAAGQLVALWGWAAGQRGRPRLVRAGAEFHRPATPSARVMSLLGAVRRKRHLYFGTIEIWAMKDHVATVEVVLAVLPAA